MVDKISELNIGGGNVQPHPAVPKMCNSDIQNFFLVLSHEKQASAILLVSDGFAKNYIPEQMKIPLPQPLGTLFDAKCKVLDFDTLAALSEEQLVKYALTPEQSIRIEELTRKQSKCQLWNSYRQGRILSQRRICSARQGLWYRGFVTQKPTYFKRRQQGIVVSDEAVFTTTNKQQYSCILGSVLKMKPVP